MRAQTKALTNSLRDILDALNSVTNQPAGYSNSIYEASGYEDFTNTMAGLTPSTIGSPTGEGGDEWTVSLMGVTLNLFPGAHPEIAGLMAKMKLLILWAARFLFCWKVLVRTNDVSVWAMRPKRDESRAGGSGKFVLSWGLTLGMVAFFGLALGALGEYAAAAITSQDAVSGLSGDGLTTIFTGPFYGKAWTLFELCIPWSQILALVLAFIAFYKLSLSVLILLWTKAHLLPF